MSFLHNFHPQAVLIKLGTLQIHWYGFLMVVGGLLGFWIILKLADHYKIDKKFFHELLIYWVIGAVVGARIYYVLYAFEFYKDNWLDVFKIWQGGLAIHGIMLGGFVATLIYCKIKKQNFWKFADVIALGLIAAQVIGRVGNYFNQEIFGKPVSWGIPIDVINRPAEYLSFEFFHPTFLYESLGSLVIFGILLLLTWFRFKRKKAIAGNIFLLYLILYSVQRFLLEFLRLDYSPLVFGVRWAQILSGGLILVCLVFLIKKQRSKLKINNKK
ncbi:prolipoprotein diacylglyceryl transferase [Candidatus Kuenenbacteria bacterium]|nr:prolipoprotein diacylglyceryl transferase [Candidatus Kuenenbacteria bacterium]